jgi:hypothetical protein
VIIEELDFINEEPTEYGSLVLLRTSCTANKSIISTPDEKGCMLHYHNADYKRRGWDAGFFYIFFDYDAVFYFDVDFSFYL